MGCSNVIIDGLLNLYDRDNLQFLVDENVTFTEFLNTKFGPWEDEAFLQTLRDLASTKITNMGACLNENMELISVRTTIHFTQFPVNSKKTMFIRWLCTHGGTDRNQRNEVIK